MNLRCFLMMQFKGKNQKEVFRRVQEAINRFNTTEGTSIQLIRADLTPPLSLASLEEHLRKQIEESDFVVAEISQLNPNVLFEMGYAIGLDRPVIIMAQEHAKVPADFRGRLYFEYKAAELDLVPQMLHSYLRSAVDSMLVRHYQTKYLCTVFENRNVSDLVPTLMEARERMQILTTNLSYVVSSDIPEIIKGRLEKCPNLTVRILTLEPESDFCAERAKQLGISIRVFRDELRQSIEKMDSVLSPFGDRIGIATYDEFPTQIFFRIDENLYTNVVSANQRARNNILFRLNARNAGVANTFLNHFDTVWGRSNILTGTGSE